MRGRTRGGAGAAWLEVEDSGPGIPPERRESVFQRHVRLDRQSGGSGLGLAIVRDIAMLHDATARAGAGPDGQGALFSVAFKN